MPVSVSFFVCLATAGLALPVPVAAQAAGHATGDLSPHIGVQGIGLLSRAAPAVGGDALTEAYLTQPMLFARLRLLGASTTTPATPSMDATGGDRSVGAPAGLLVDAAVTLNFEGWTLRRGELAAGNAGEGFVDRRHPHTLMHEAVLTGSTASGVWRASLTTGRGFAPFGTDDPMVRPFVKYPTNHHLSQILERWVVIGAITNGSVIVEAGLFNGDEPVGPWSLGRPSRFADSWSVRGTVLARPWLELQLSRAVVESPEHFAGAGLDQRKWSASARLDVSGDGGSGVYFLGEWAETSEWTASERAYLFRTWLGEAAWRRAGWKLAGRLERTTRPEEERLRNAFRSIRPHADDNIVGITRWTTATLHAAHEAAIGALALAPFVEASYSAVAERTGSIFDPAAFYGDDRILTLSLGLRLAVGARHHRMGRYGVAVPAGASMHE